MDVSTRGINPLAFALREAIANHDRGQHIKLALGYLAKRHDIDLLILAIGIAHRAAPRIGAFMSKHDAQDFVNADKTPLALHVVQRNREVGLRNMARAMLDPLPGA